MTSTADTGATPRPYYVIVAGLPGVLEVINVRRAHGQRQVSAMARAQSLHTLDLPNDVVLMISLHHVQHWTVTPERPKDILIVPVALP
jgi:hypothetical protein